MVRGKESDPAKLLLPYLQRADELQKLEPLIAYYCRMYAMDRGLQIPQDERTETTTGLLHALMDRLEKDKKTLKLGHYDCLYVEGFASNVFTKADKQDRAGRADLNTAKTFYAASIFFEILYQFSELQPQPEIEQKRKYAVWKAADIRKALKEGRKPEPGPPGDDEDPSILSSLPRDAHDAKPCANLSSPPLDENTGRNEVSYGDTDMSSWYAAIVNRKYSGQAFITTSSASPDQPTVMPDNSAYSQHYDDRIHTTEQQHVTQNYQTPENPSSSYSYPNFQSYPGFDDSIFSAVPTHQPSFYHGPDVACSPQTAPSVPNFSSSVKYSGDNSNHAKPPSASAENYKYDGNYQPSVSKISAAHRAARFAVGALAFDDVPIAVDFLRHSLELLTNPSAETNQ